MELTEILELSSEELGSKTVYEQMQLQHQISKMVAGGTTLTSTQAIKLLGIYNESRSLTAYNELFQEQLITYDEL